MAAYEKIAEEMKDMDIAMLTLNAGCASIKWFKDCTN
jgi:hypothetical protein